MAKESKIIQLIIKSIIFRKMSRLPLISDRRRRRFERSAEKRRNLYENMLVAEKVSEKKADTTPNTFPYKDIEPHYAASQILVICTHAPTIKHAGGLRIVDMIHKIKNKHAHTYIELFTSNNFKLYGPLGEIAQIVDHVTFAENYNFSLEEFLRSTPEKRFFDIIDFQFPQPLDVIESFRSIGRKLIFTPMESHIRNECISREVDRILKGDLISPTAIEEAEICQMVDQVVCVSEKDRAAIAACLDANITAIETCVSDIEFANPSSLTLSDAPVVCFVAYFGSETNREALRWLIDKVHPQVRKVIGDYELRIVGRGDVSDIVKNAPAGVKYIGEVERISPHIETSAVGVAIALSGSGFRGKINQYAYMSVPCVANSLAADGMAYADGQSIMIADTPEDFADRIITLLRDSETRKRMGRAAAEICHSVYGWESKWPMIAEVYELSPYPEVVTMPTVHAVVPSYRHAPYIEERLRSIFRQEYPNIRVTVIDDHSDDGSHEIIEKLRKEFTFDYIRREQNSGSPFSAWEYATQNTKEDLIWICESDDSCAPMLVSRLVQQITMRKRTKIAYCASWVVDKDGLRLESTDPYFSEVFHSSRWLRPFVAHGERDLRQFQCAGMIVPNMSGALIDTEVFRSAFTENIKQYRLAGDWLFMGQAMRLGDIAYIPERLNFFRRHENTARQKTTETRLIAEHISVRFSLSILSGLPTTDISRILQLDLRKLLMNPELIEPVKMEMRQFDPENEKRLTALLNELG